MTCKRYHPIIAVLPALLLCGPGHLLTQEAAAASSASRTVRAAQEVPGRARQAPEPRLQDVEDEAKLTFEQKVKLGFPRLWGEFSIETPEGRRYKMKTSPTQADMSAYRTPLESKILSRRYHSSPGMYLANEEFLSGLYWAIDAVNAGMPVANWPEWLNVTHREGYWYSRYALSYVQAQAHMGIHMLHGPYWTLKARDHSRKNRFIRDRNERNFSNKDVLLGIYLPMYLKRIGWPRIFEDANPTMLDYASGDPHLVGPVVTSDTFDDPQSDKEGGWGIPSYLIDFSGTRWDHDSIDTTIDLGGVGQTFKKKALWSREFFKGDRIEPSPSDGELVTLLGNSADEGMRGIALTLGMVNTLLALKSELLADRDGDLGGVNPLEYNPAKGLRYIPHSIEPDLILVGDLPERPNGYDVDDATSQLWDQASLLWGISDFYDQTYRFSGRVFSHDPPGDGGIIELSIRDVARGLCELMVANLAELHKADSGVLASSWHPGRGRGSRVSIKDSSMIVVALSEYLARFGARGEADPDRMDQATEMLEAQAEFVLKIQRKDGAFHEAYDVATNEGIGPHTLATPQWFGIRVLMAAWNFTEDDRYLVAARRTWNLLNSRYWHEETGVYRTALGDDTAIYTPMDLGAAFGAFRELAMATPIHRARPLLERYVRFWTQSMNSSGMQMGEDHSTGEYSFGIVSTDHDRDGIPFFAVADEGEGLAPIPAGRIAINLGDDTNSQFTDLEGDLRRTPSHVRARYRPMTRTQQQQVLVPEKEPEHEELVERGEMDLFVGLTQLLPPSRPVTVGSSLSGKEIYKRNCLACHGDRGEGQDGLSLQKDFGDIPDNVIQTVTYGRIEKGMPPWGSGIDELAKVLSEEEIARVVEYIQTDLRETNEATKTLKSYQKSQKNRTTTRSQ